VAEPSAEERLAELDEVFNALASPARRQILMAVYFRGRPLSAGEIAGRFAHAWPTTTRHVRLLEAAGLLEQTTSGREDGRQRLYQVNRNKLKVIRRWLQWFFEEEEGS
jgi:DNA-binding transcriptional ArsR family regulator